MKINFVGDLCLDHINSDDFCIHEEVLNIFKNGDLNVANLESPLTFTGNVRPNTAVALKSTPQKNKIFDIFHIYSLANNHILDYGVKGLQDTIGFLNKEGKGFLGAGMDLKDAFRSFVLENKGRKIAFLGFTRWVNARKKKPGTTPASQKRLMSEISYLKNEGYFVVVLPHWNYEYVYFPAPDNRRLARKLIDSGADLIVGSHPHIIQGFEKYKNKYIFHSLGNFIFHSKVFKSISMIENDPRLNDSLLLSVTLKDDFDYAYTLTPLFSDDHELRLLKSDEKDRFDGKLAEISGILEDPREYRKRFYRDAGDISRQTVKMFKKLSVEQGPMSLLGSLRRIKKQDVKIKLHSLLERTCRT